MKLTKHANKRLRQRGFSKLSLDIIRECGLAERAPEGAIKVFFGKKEYQKVVTEFKRAIQVLDKAKGGTIIMENEDVLTIYHRDNSPSQPACLFRRNRPLVPEESVHVFRSISSTCSEGKRPRSSERSDAVISISQSCSR